MVKKVIGHKDEKIKRLQYQLDISRADYRMAIDSFENSQREIYKTMRKEKTEVAAKLMLAFVIACPGSFIAGAYIALPAIHEVMNWITSHAN